MATHMLSVEGAAVDAIHSCRGLLVGDRVGRFECIRRSNAGGDLVQSSLIRRIDTFRQKAAGLIAFRSGIGQACIRPNTESQSFEFPLIAVVHPPVASACRGNQQIEAIGIG